MAEKLEPCPFCNGEAEIEELEGGANQGTKVWCKSCHVRSPWFDGYYEPDGRGKENAIKAWNTRAIQPLDEEKVAKFLFDGKFQEPVGISWRRVAKAICSQFGTPKIKLVEEKLNDALVTLDPKKICPNDSSYNYGYISKAVINLITEMNKGE